MGVINVCFCSFENDTTKLFYIELGVCEIGKNSTPLIQNEIEISYKYAEIPSINNPDNKIVAFGHIEGINDSVYLEKTWEHDDIKTAIRLIKKQADTTPDIVGSPIDVLILKKRKIHMKRYY